MVNVISAHVGWEEEGGGGVRVFCRYEVSLPPAACHGGVYHPRHNNYAALGVFLI